MEDILCRLKNLLESGKSPEETLPNLRECISLFAANDHDHVAEQVPAVLEKLLVDVVKPLFASPAARHGYTARFSDSPRKLWKDSAPWCVDILKFVLDKYGTLPTLLQKQAIESHFGLLVPPILALLDDDDFTQKKVGCDLLRVLCNCLSDCGSEMLRRTGLAKVFEESLAPNMLLLPSLTPEEQSLAILGSLYPAYRALITVSFSASSSALPAHAGKLISVAAGRQLSSCRTPDQHTSRQAMLDKIFRDGILAGYIHASDHVQIATLLVSEMSYVIAMMGASSAKYLSRLLPLLRTILTNPLGTACQPLLRSAVTALRELILQCWPRIAEVWWEECLRATVGLWLVANEEDDDEMAPLKDDARGLMDLLVQVKGQAEAQKDFDLLKAEYPPLEELISNC